MDEFSAWISESGYLTLSIVLLVWLTERYLSWPPAYHPLSLFRLIAANLAIKVNPHSPRTDGQRKIAGALAIIILLVPMAMIIAMLVFLAPYPFIFDGLMLLVAIQYRPVGYAYRQIAANIKHNKKALARQYLDQIVLRDSEQLSPLGIAKAAIESLILRTQAQQVCVIFWFLLTGGLGALLVRLIYELQQCWSVKLSRFRAFGRPAAILWRGLNYVPRLVFLVAFAIAQNITGAIKGMTRGSGSTLSSTSIRTKRICGSALGIQLSGPVMYEGIKVRLPRIGGEREVRFGDLKRTQGAIYRTQAVLLVSLIIATVLFETLGGKSYAF